MKISKRKFLIIVLPFLGAASIGASVASAHGFIGMDSFGGRGFGGTQESPDQIVERHTMLFQSEATLLGIDVSVVKDAWASGKTVEELAKENGISEADFQKRIEDARAAKVKSEIQTLVSRGIITQAQADARLKTLADQAALMKKIGRKMMGRRLPPGK